MDFFKQSISRNKDQARNMFSQHNNWPPQQQQQQHFPSQQTFQPRADVAFQQASQIQVRSQTQRRDDQPVMRSRVDMSPPRLMRVESKSEEEPMILGGVEDGEEEEVELISKRKNVKRVTAMDSDTPMRHVPASVGKRRRQQDAGGANDLAVHERLLKIRRGVVGHSNPSTPTRTPNRVSSTPQRKPKTPPAVATGTKRKQFAFPEDDDEEGQVLEVLEGVLTGLKAEEGWVTPASFRMSKRRRANGEGDVVLVVGREEGGKEDQVPVHVNPAPQVAAVSTSRGRVKMGGTPLKESHRASSGGVFAAPTPVLRKPLREEDVERLVDEKIAGAETPGRKVKFADEDGGCLEAGPSPSVGKVGLFGVGGVKDGKGLGEGKEEEGKGLLFGGLGDKGKETEAAASSALFAGFGTVPETTSAVEEKKDVAASSAGSSLFAGIGAGPATTAAVEEKKDAPAVPAVPSFSGFGSASASTGTKVDEAKAAPAASFSFGAAPSPSPATASTTTPVAAPVSGGFSFGALSTPEATKTAEKPAASSGGFSFGDSKAASTPATEAVKPAAVGGFNFGGASASVVTAE
ncbi:hypothetical protein HDU98_009599, partial [Podochytrium sp. JEL0797]